MPSEKSLDRTFIISHPSSVAVLESLPGNTSDMGLPAAGRPGTPIPANRNEPTHLGRFRLVRKLGQGGMGAVYLGEDDEGGQQVALKVLSREAVPDEQAVRRFQKEARLLAEVRHPHVTNLLEAGEANGTCYLVMEFVNGGDLRGLLIRHRQLPERLALQIICDVADALSAAHERGIIHRDIKPANILLAAEPVADETPADAVSAAVEAGCKPLVKLSDFGLARHIDQSESMNLTRTGAMLGTPYYIAPEQCTDTSDVSPATDIYALGATLFEMLAGRPPFVASDPVKLITMHCFEDAPDLRKLNPAISDGVARLVARALQKKPESRYANAAHLHSEIDRLLRGETNDVELHPVVPTTTSEVIEAVWEWNLAASPEQLWPLVSNTERINSAVGVPAVEYTTERDAQGGLRKFGTFRLGWAVMNWEEHPFEWVEGRRLGVLREFSTGPFHWFLSIVELEPRSTGGTKLKHTVRIAPRGILGKLLACLEVKVKGRRAVDRVYTRMDMVASGRLTGAPALDAFVPPATLGKSTRRRFEARLHKLHEAGVDGDCMERLVQFLIESPAQELARIRPLALAKRLNVAADQLTETCLHACQAGLLELHWDILCPTCRISSTVKDTLAEIDRHARCEACNLDFDVDFGNAVELIFRVHPEMRQADLKTYCIGGPEHAPHVIAQARLGAGESLELDLALDAGTYVLRGPQLPYTVTLAVRTTTGTGRASLPLSSSFDATRFPPLHAGRQLLTLENKYDRPLVVRIERTIPRPDVLTAAQASRLQLFRQLFPAEVLSRDRLSDYSACTLLAIRAVNVAELCEKWGDAAAYLKVSERWRSLRQEIEAGGGQVVKEMDEQLLAAFPETLNALRAALDLLGQSVDQGDDCPGDAFDNDAATTRGGRQSLMSPGLQESRGNSNNMHIQLRAALNRGAALATSINGRLDYFGRTVTNTTGLLDTVSRQTLVISEDLARDREIIAFLSEQRLTLNPCRASRASGIGNAVEVSFPESDLEEHEGNAREPRKRNV